MSQFAITSVLLIAISPAIGSFLAVLIDRLPRAEDVVSERSACRSCGTKLGPLSLVPIISFIVQKGRCNSCHAVIPAWLLYTEILATGAAILAVTAANGIALSAILNTLFLWLLIGLAVADLKWFRLPDLLTLSLAIVAFLLAFSPAGLEVTAVLGAILGAGSFSVLRFSYKLLRGKEGLGLGDVKLMVGLGAFTGPQGLPILVLLAACTALFMAGIQHVTKSQEINKQSPLPFGAALCWAAFVLWLIGNS